jgi:ABC-2 type transport system ATP-binding protein
MKPVLIVDRLVKKFSVGSFWRRSRSEITAVNAISFELKQGEVLGFLGANGSGKTTTIQMLLGTMTPTSGSITYFGRNFAEHRSESLQHVTYASAYAKLLGRLSILDNLSFFGALYGLSPSEIQDRSKDLLKYFSMWDRRNQAANELSAGQTTRVMLAKAFLPRPKIVLLDEPTASLDPDIALEVRKFILHQQREEGISVLFTSHNMEEVAEICDRILVLTSGTIIANDTPENLARSIATTRVSLMAETPENLQQMAEYATQRGLKAVIRGHIIDIEIDEAKVATLLYGLARASLKFTSISITSPRLEDYFLHIARLQRSGKKKAVNGNGNGNGNSSSPS